MIPIYPNTPCNNNNDVITLGVFLGELSNSQVLIRMVMMRFLLLIFIMILIRSKMDGVKKELLPGGHVEELGDLRKREVSKLETGWQFGNLDIIDSLGSLAALTRLVNRPTFQLWPPCQQFIFLKVNFLTSCCFS